MIKTRYFFILFIVVCIGAVSCISDNILTFQTYKIPENTWNYKDSITFKTFITDTQKWYDIYLDVRNSGKYPYSNLYLFITTIHPDNKKSTDTIENILADDSGRWLGKGLSDIKDNRFLYKKNMRFSLKGNYTFKIVQAMRVEDLIGISDIGLRIEKK